MSASPEILKEKKKEDPAPVPPATDIEMRDQMLAIIFDRDQKILEATRAITVALDLALYRKQYEIASILKGSLDKISGAKTNG